MRSRRLAPLTAALGVVTAAAAAAAVDGVVPANATRIAARDFEWVGRRTVDAASGAVAFDFPGVTATVAVGGATFFALEFTGTCPGGTVRLESAVDSGNLSTHAPGAFWLTHPTNVTVAAGLDPLAPPHVLRVRLATEARNGGCGAAGSQPNSTVVFGGVWTDGALAPPSAGGHFQRRAAAPAPAPRRIEWVGDSITAGAADAPDPACGGMPAMQDPSAAASLGLACPALGAECAIVAVSGDTVLTPVPPIVAQAEKPPLPMLYNRSHTYIPAAGAPGAGSAWDFSSWVPQAVVMNLGTNDVAAGNFASAYTPALTGFIAQIAGPAGVYASAGLPVPTVLAWCGPMTTTYCAPMEAAVQAALALGAKAAFLGPVNATLDGCDGHPGPRGQAEVGAALAPRIQAAMGWAAPAPAGAASTGR
jgi:hypothetical protein